MVNPKISKFAGEITTSLLRHQVKLLIVVCSTMAAVAREIVEELSPVPSWR
jgi:glutamate racemase